jgi:2-dehydro-3-deoxygluconokinase
MSTILCFGELLLRLGAPGRERLLQTPRFDVQIGGAEANVAVQLAQLGHRTRVASVVPDHALGAAAIGELRRWNVDTTAVQTGAGRMGLYFLATGALHRPSEVLYDRADSAFARAAVDAFDWDALLEDVDVLHLSGVTPALGAIPAAAAIRAARAARERQVLVSFDGNFRGKLWQAWHGDAPALLRELFSLADIAFADHRDFAIVLGQAFDATPPERAPLVAAEAAFAAFPNLDRVACTLRTQHHVDHHELAAVMSTRSGEHSVAPQTLHPIVDRIGAGDAFAAGVLHGLLTDRDDATALQLGLAAACLKHATPGDFGLASATDLDAFLGERRFDVRR